MSALQASRKYGVPSRTLYDKVKKMGILTANMQKQLQQKKNSETPSKSENGMNSMSNFSPISLLGMQLPQSTLPTTTVPQVNGDPRQPITSKSCNSSYHLLTLHSSRSSAAVNDREDKASRSQQASAGRRSPQPVGDAGQRVWRGGQQEW